MSKVFLIGNGESRKDFDLEKLRSHGKIYGCNALYRDFKPDALVSVDHGIMHEIYHSGYAKDNVCYFRDWTPVPQMHYDMMVYAGLDKVQQDALAKWDVKKENEKGDSDEFVMHGCNLNGLAKILHKTGKIEEKHVNSNQLAISWVKPDKVTSIDKVAPDYKDHGWAAGATSGWVATNIEKPKEVYLIGHDLNSLNDRVNNVYKGTKHYVTPHNSVTPSVNWIDQWNTLMTWKPNIKYYKVNTSLTRIHENDKVNLELPEWQRHKTEGRLEYIDYQRLDKLLGL